MMIYSADEIYPDDLTSGSFEDDLCLCQTCLGGEDHTDLERED